MTAASIATSIALGAVGSLLAAIVWLFALRHLRPNLVLSPHLVEERHELEDGSAVTYALKIINRGRRSVVDLQFELLSFAQDERGADPSTAASCCRSRDDLLWSSSDTGNAMPSRTTHTELAQRQIFANG